MLKPTGLKIIRALNGKEAVDCMSHKANIDIIPMDIQLPEMDGFEATQRIKKIKPAVPIIAQTAYALADERAKALDAGCDYYLSKPISADALLYLLNQVLVQS